MTSKFNASMFESIRESLQKKATSSSFQDFLKLEIGKTYVVRLLPNIENLDRTFFHYYNHMWTSLATNQLTSVLCPSTYGERCPIDEYRFKVYRSGSDAEKEQSKILRRNENWLVNVYVISDPTNPENEGKIKLLRYGKQLNKVIFDATEGDDVQYFGHRVFDLSENGCSLRIKVDKNEGGYASYTSSKFLPAGSIAGLSDNVEAINSIYDNVKVLDKVFESKSYDEVQHLLDTHYFCKETAPAAPKSQTKTVTTTHTPTGVTVEEDDDGIITTSTSNFSEASDLSEEERKMQEILNGL
jgi:hypothetical protein